MNKLSTGIGFLAGFVVATVIGLALVVPTLREMWQVNVDSDVYRGVQGALEDIEQSEANGDCEKAAAQLKLFNERFTSFRDGGPTPANWWREVVATTRPAR